MCYENCWDSLNKELIFCYRNISSKKGSQIHSISSNCIRVKKRKYRYSLFYLNYIITGIHTHIHIHTSIHYTNILIHIHLYVFICIYTHTYIHAFYEFPTHWEFVELAWHRYINPTHTFAFGYWFLHC